MRTDAARPRRSSMSSHAGDARPTSRGTTRRGRAPVADASRCSIVANIVVSRLTRPLSCAVARRLFFDTALRELGRVEQAREIGRAEIRLGCRDVADRTLLAIRLFRDRRALLVADHGIQR